MIEGRQRADDAAAYRHRMGVAPEALIEARQLLVDHRVQRDVALEGRLLCGVRQVALEQEVAYLHEVAVLG